MTTTIKVTDSAGHVTTQTITLQVNQSTGKKIIGMSASSNLWSQRLSEVGANGIRARRIFCDLTSTGNDQKASITQAINDNMIPIVSYKLPNDSSGAPDISGGLNGKYDSWASAAATFLNSFGKTVVATVWHEPRGDMTTTQYKSLHKRYAPLFKKTNIKFGPILNGFLLDNLNRPAGDNYVDWFDDELLNTWDYMGMDVYQTGTQDAPGKIYPGDRIAPLLKVLTARGKQNMPIVIGEYNGFTADCITKSGETFLSTPTLWIASMWNTTGGKGQVLTGDRLAAFKATKADSRVLQ